MNWVWGKAALIRAAKTFAQVSIASIGTAAFIADVNWVAVLSSAVLAAILSVLTSVAGLPEVSLAAENKKLKDHNKGSENAD